MISQMGSWAMWVNVNLIMKCESSKIKPRTVSYICQSLILIHLVRMFNSGEKLCMHAFKKKGKIQIVFFISKC